MESIEATYDEEYTLPANEFTRIGYTFTYWLGSDGFAYSAEDTVSNLTTEDGATITLYAQWENYDSIIAYNFTQYKKSTSTIAPAEASGTTYTGVGSETITSHTVGAAFTTTRRNRLH